MKIKDYFKDLSKAEKRKMIFGFLRVAFERQRGYAAWATPILLAGLYGSKIKIFIVNFVSTYWFLLIPLWFIGVFFDMFVLLPGEQVFYAKSNKILMEMHEGIKTNGQKASINHKP